MEDRIRDSIKVHFTDFFQVSTEGLEEYGAFNISLINDLPLFIDPFLLFNSENPQYKKLHDNIVKYVIFLRDMSLQVGINRGLLRNWFVFSEVRQNWLGYSKVGNRGSGLGNDFANTLHRNLNTVFANFGREEITIGSHLERLCLIKEGVGKDNISDFTTNLIKDFLLEYTQEFARKYVKRELVRKFTISRVHFNYRTRSWESGVYYLPCYADDYVILTPKDILTKEETWINRHDMILGFENLVTALPNEQLRAQVNQYFLLNMPANPKQGDKERTIWTLIKEHPEIIDYYIREKEDRGDEAVDVSKAKVEETENVYIRGIKDLIYKLYHNSRFYEAHPNTYQETRERVLFLKDVIENKDGYRIFYDSDKPIRREADLQLFFRLTWFASLADVNREVDNGRGPVDYKISHGGNDSTLVEFKLASNSQLKRNLKNQVGVYEKASNPTHKSIKVILYFSESELKKVREILEELMLAHDDNIILIDARNDNKTSASKV